MNNENKYTYNEILEMGEVPEDFYAPDALYDEFGYVINYNVSLPNTGFEKINETLFKKINNDFHLSKITHNLKCKKCGSSCFEVGQGSYFTAIKCVDCLYEICIHDG